MDWLINSKMGTSEDKHSTATRGKRGQKTASKANDTEKTDEGVVDNRTIDMKSGPGSDKKGGSDEKETNAAGKGVKNKDGNTKVVKKGAKTKVSVYRSSPERKKYKITKHIDQPNKKSWQIRGFRIQQGLVGFYFQKSLNSGRDEQPFLFNFMKKFDRDQDLREVQLGVIYVGSRSDGGGNLIQADPGFEKSEWHLFLAAEQDVGSLEQWLGNVCKRMNDDEVAGNEKLFKWNPSFAVTSYGDEAKIPKLHEVIMYEQVIDFVIGLFSLKNPLNRGKALDDLNLGGYFESDKDGKDAINAHFAY